MASTDDRTSSAASSCAQPMRGLYGATTICARPAGHTGKHDPIWNHKDWPEASSAAQGRGFDGSDSYDPYALDPDRDKAPDFPERSAASIDYTCAACGKPVTVPHTAAWPSRCPHCGTAPPTLLVRVGGATVAAGRTGL